MVKYYRINEVVKLTSVSVRTLHYYDEINLLNPSHRTASGHRRYSKDDLLKLQQITTFKFMSFSLTNIQGLLQNPNFNLHESLKIQAEVLTEEAAKISKISKLLCYLMDQIKVRETIDWEIVIKIIEALQLTESERQKWYEKYLSTDELYEFEKFCGHRTDEYWNDYHKRWKLMFDEVKENLQTDPEGDIGIYLAKKWLSLVDEVHSDKVHLRSKLWEGYKAGVIPQEQLPYDKGIIDYISHAVNKLNKISIENN